MKIYVVSCPGGLVMCRDEDAVEEVFEAGIPVLHVEPWDTATQKFMVVQAQDKFEDREPDLMPLYDGLGDA